jgi:hypothetical protein
MELNRFAVAGIAACALFAAGCSSSDSSSESTSTQATTTASATSASATSSAPTSTSAAAGALDDSTCLDIGFAKDNLMVAGDAGTARKNADTLEKYSPPDPVKAAVEHFVTTVGAQPNDPDLDANRNLITDWLKQVCPNVK